jgi:hypothetical protein
MEIKEETKELLVKQPRHAKRICKNSMNPSKDKPETHGH